MRRIYRSDATPDLEASFRSKSFNVIRNKLELMIGPNDGCFRTARVIDEFEVEALALIPNGLLAFKSFDLEFDHETMDFKPNVFLCEIDPYQDADDLLLNCIEPFQTTDFTVFFGGVEKRIYADRDKLNIGPSDASLIKMIKSYNNEMSVYIDNSKLDMIHFDGSDDRIVEFYLSAPLVDITFHPIPMQAAGEKLLYIFGNDEPIIIKQANPNDDSWHETAYCAISRFIKEHNLVIDVIGFPHDPMSSTASVIGYNTTGGAGYFVIERGSSYGQKN